MRNLILILALLPITFACVNNSKKKVAEEPAPAVMEIMKGERSMYMDYFEKIESIIGTSAYEDLMYKNAMDILGMGK
mgnify:CR=1 FL=1